MFEGGISFNKGSDKAVRYIALLGTPIFVGYNLLVMMGFVTSTNYVSDAVCILLSVLWILVGAYHYFAPIRSKVDMLSRLVLYHGLALATLMFITGFLEPFSSSITLLFLASNIYFGRKALLLSFGAVIFAGALDAAVRYPMDPDILLTNTLGVLGILILGVSLVGIIIAQETRRKSLVHSQEKEKLQYDRISTIINNLTDATFSTDEKGIIKLYNAASLDLIDTNNDIHGKSIDTLLTISDADGEWVSISDLLKNATKTTRRDDLRHTYVDGEQIRIEITYAPIRSSFTQHKKDRLEMGYIVIIRDVTKSKSLEEERDEFISVVSHELRTPITIMEGTLSNLQLMMSRKDLVKSGAAEEAVSKAHDQSVYLAKMVNDLSTLSRAERGASDEGEDMDVRELAHKMHDAYHKSATAKKLRLDIDLGTHLGSVHASRLYIEELLQNFITNAIKYTKEGTITFIVQRNKNEVTFTVKDTGIGMSRSDQAKIFHKFYRSEDYRIRETGGTGLGLYVAAKLAHKLGTKIELTSRLNHGSSFSFTLPTIDE